MYMHIRIYTLNLYMHFSDEKSVYALWILYVFGINTGWIILESVRNEWKFDLLIKNSVWRRLRRAKKGL